MQELQINGLRTFRDKWREKLSPCGSELNSKKMQRKASWHEEVNSAAIFTAETCNGKGFSWRRHLSFQRDSQIEAAAEKEHPIPIKWDPITFLCVKLNEFRAPCLVKGNLHRTHQRMNQNVKLPPKNWGVRAVLRCSWTWSLICCKKFVFFPFCSTNLMKSARVTEDIFHSFLESPKTFKEFRPLNLIGTFMRVPVRQWSLSS